MKWLVEFYSSMSCNYEKIKINQFNIHDIYICVFVMRYGGHIIRIIIIIRLDDDCFR